MNRGGAAFPAHEPSPVAASRQSAAVRRNNQPAALCRDAATPRSWTCKTVEATHERRSRGHQSAHSEWSAPTDVGGYG